MRIKIYLHPNRDIELIAIRFNPALNFGKLAKEAVKAYVRNREFSFAIPSKGEFIPQPLTCSMSLDEDTDADIIEYMESLVISKSAFVRNIMLKAVEGKTNAYTDAALKRKIIAYQLHKKK